jgi:hypothetical protein
LFLQLTRLPSQKGDGKTPVKVQNQYSQIVSTYGKENSAERLARPG